VRSPDASVVRLDRWQALSEPEREGFAPICPDLVVELASPSDQPQALRHKMAVYMANGASLGWLLLPQSRTVEVWTAAETANFPLVLNEPSRLVPRQPPGALSTSLSPDSGCSPTPPLGENG
jgi:Uma2 family endonuclease